MKGVYFNDSWRSGVFDSGYIWKKYDGTSPFVIRDSRLEGAQFLPPLVLIL